MHCPFVLVSSVLYRTHGDRPAFTRRQSALEVTLMGNMISSGHMRQLCSHSASATSVLLSTHTAEEAIAEI
ncbi:hypothetical protein DAEQUDRAFT_606267 [Daedalea quercina L-15889]|uniref:Uncharacterized protein n=1 Tax=Daedalea quercina L-15889 TaxID=1314783 RepID=A0A165LK76_9APHY|nr:hypothetical protein DAEQUDRAFT_606267 [Daedalea quercina L-15889]